MPHWREREDMWTCLRCRADLPAIPLGRTSYMVARPYMETRVISEINAAVDRYGAERVRIRAGDPATATVRPTPTPTETSRP